MALGEKVKNMDLIDLSVVGHPPFLVRVLIGLSAVTLPPYNPPTTRPPSLRVDMVNHKHVVANKLSTLGVVYDVNYCKTYKHSRRRP